ncbi:MAG: hypothetical protein OEY04_11415 [Gammaproteobacteria bacterium]|nr:hypothetical protein [Gammaproteobacteria bacterium]
MNRQDETMIYGLSVAERDVLQKKLQELADTMPPRAVWQRIETQAKAQGLFARKGIGESLKWISGAAIAATVALAVLRFPLGPEIDLENDTFPTEPVYQESVANSSGNGGLRAVRALMVQSRQLESDLRALPDQPQLARAGTLAAIMDLEDRIAAIDNILNDPASQLTPEQSETYWRERVRLMSSLLQLRYAQAQRMSF